MDIHKKITVLFVAIAIVILVLLILSAYYLALSAPV
ncbi:MAG: hypothetical protein RLZZ469_859 [Bacteroidota bacterium]|jgi:hypothetical protein